MTTLKVFDELCFRKRELTRAYHLISNNTGLPILIVIGSKTQAYVVKK